jgi:hypothetical protein
LDVKCCEMTMCGSGVRLGVCGSGCAARGVRLGVCGSAVRLGCAAPCVRLRGRDCVQDAICVTGLGHGDALIPLKSVSPTTTAQSGVPLVDVMTIEHERYS